MLRRIETFTSPVPAFASDYADGGGGGGLEVSCVNPRGRFRLSLHRDGIVLADPRDADARIPLSRDRVDWVVVFRKPEDYRRMGGGGGGANGGGKGRGGGGATSTMPGHLVLVCLNNGGDVGDRPDEKGGIEFKGKPLTQVCFQLPSHGDSAGSSSSPTEEDWLDGLRSALLAPRDDDDDDGRGGDGGTMIRVRSAMERAGEDASGGKFHAFRSAGGDSGSSITTDGMPFVGCYRGFHDGALFPLEEGLLFFKPPMFVHRSRLASISCGRGSGGSRYVDMIATLDDGDDEGGEEDDDGGEEDDDVVVDDGQKEKKEKKEKEKEKKKKKTKKKNRSSRSDASGTLEFTNIHRDELAGLNDYVHGVLIPAMQSDAADGDDDDDGGARVAAANDDGGARDAARDGDGGGDGDDDDLGDANGGCEGGRGRRPPPRAASRAAREVNRAALLSAPRGGGGGTTTTTTTTGALAEEEGEGGGREGDDDDDDDDSEEFREEDGSESDDDDDDDSEVLSDGESVSSEDSEGEGTSSSDGEDFDDDAGDADDSEDYSDYNDRRRKKARAE
jgi:hypothetical protein